MKRKKYFALLCSAIVFGCSSLSTQFKTADEPSDGSRARVRVVANTLVKAVPGKDCIDWEAPGAGTVFGGIVGSKGYRGRSLDIPPSTIPPGADTAEMYIAADRPFTLALLTPPDSRVQCSIAVWFTPEANGDYQATLLADARTKKCSARVDSLSKPGTFIKAGQAAACQ
jgi:hypothetical protein